jgi:hypothetical protein
METVTSKTTGNDYLPTSRRQTAQPHTSAMVSVDRAALWAELEATRTAFLAFLDALSPGQWREKSPSSAWTQGEVALHLTWALEQLPQEVASARRGRGMFNSPKQLDGLADALSYWYTRWLARKATPASIALRYDAAMTAVLHSLDEVKDSDWALGAPFYGHGFYSIEDLFHTPAEHLAEHTGGLKR